MKKFLFFTLLFSMPAVALRRMVAILLFTFAFTLLTFGQTPFAFKYQAVARNANGSIIPNQPVSFRISILQTNTTGPVVFSETHQSTTNQMGLVTLEVGNGMPVSGSLQTIDWSADVFFMQVELDPTGGTNYILSGFSQLLPVPYALYAENVRNNNDADADSINELQKLKLAGYDLILDRGNKITLPADDTSSTNEIQALSFTNDTLFLSNGGFVYLGNYDNLAAISQLFQKVITDSTYLKQLIDLNAVSITDLTQSLNVLSVKHKTDSTALANDIKTVSDNLTIETYIRNTNDNSLLVKIVSDSTTLATGTKAVSDNLAVETSSRISSDNLLQIKVASDSSYFQGLHDNLNSSLITETANRIAADNTLGNKEVGDSALMRGLITTNQANISIHTTAINTETTNRIAADNSILSKVSNDSTTLRTVINTNASNLNTETNNRISADNVLGNKQVADSSFLHGMISTNTNNLSTHIASDLDLDSTNELQTLALSNDSLFISSKNTVFLDIDRTDRDTTNEVQTLSFISDTLSISKGNYIPIDIDRNDRDSTNELQTISISNDTLSIIKGNYVKLPNITNLAYPDGFTKISPFTACNKFKPQNGKNAYITSVFSGNKEVLMYPVKKY